ncbi:MAG TPA: hypothetical protein VKH19_03050 [Gemmatimonadaceae bacterium]|nr:hypothetical protein [Gemmatimonadaceae bacterium]
MQTPAPAPARPPQTQQIQQIQQIQQTPQPTLFTVPASAVPQTASEVNAVRMKIDDLRESLQDFAERRNSVASQLRRADMDARPGYQGRLANLDANINEMQNQITQATLALANAPASAFVGASSTRSGPAFPNFSRGPEVIIPIAGIIGGVAITLSLIGLVRAIFVRRASTARAIPDPEMNNQMRQLQQSVDTIALEVERISESQRFMTKVFASRDPAAAQLSQSVDR